MSQYVRMPDDEFERLWRIPIPFAGLPWLDLLVECRRAREAEERLMKGLAKKKVRHA